MRTRRCAVIATAYINTARPLVVVSQPPPWQGDVDYHSPSQVPVPRETVARRSAPRAAWCVDSPHGRFPLLRDASWCSSSDARAPSTISYHSGGGLRPHQDAGLSLRAHQFDGLMTGQVTISRIRRRPSPCLYSGSAHEKSARRRLGSCSAEASSLSSCGSGASRPYSDLPAPSAPWLLRQQFGVLASHPEVL